MKRTAAALFLFFATWSLHAQDFGVRFQPFLTRVPVHARVSHSIVVTKPQNAGDVVLEVDLPGEVEISGNCTGMGPWRCTVSHGLFVYATMNEPGTYTATVRLIGTGDANPQNDQDSWTFEVVDAPSLSVSPFADRYDAGQTADVYVSAANYGAEAKDVVLTLTLPEEGTFTGRIAGAELPCDVTPDTIVCTLPSLANHANFSLRVEVVMPDRFDGGTVPFAASIASSAPDFDPADDAGTATATLIRQLVVDNTNDDGPGSLRQALLDARQLCATELCTIGFRIAGAGEDGRFVIRPGSELPEVQGEVKIDGATQTRFGGDTNPDGPEIVLDGSLSPPARGLVLGGPSCEMYVLDLGIVNFAAPGIAAYRGPYDYRKCAQFLFPNTLIARNHISGNYRGIVLVGDNYATIAENVIARNQRAGIFADRSWQVVIRRNRITDNGASGIFLHPDNPFRLQAVVVEENVISGNAEWGIARVAVGDASIRKNSIFGNRYLAIDAGLDLVTPNRIEDSAYVPGVPNKPVLISAQYDPATGKTRVHGRLDSDPRSSSASFTIDVYASASLSAAGQAEAEQWLAETTRMEMAVHTDFVIEVEGDLRGRYITATNTRRHIVFWDDSVFNTSEISNAIPVQ